MTGGWLLNYGRAVARLSISVSAAAAHRACAVQRCAIVASRLISAVPLTSTCNYQQRYSYIGSLNLCESVSLHR
ncbi:hypothetical protein AAFF_G00394380 [Aldrovandia affinis]|uniref:Uncharacterized protein n=1 Tax=Aldrovandia affinis TaxID=143900 RepID=A0AAD7SDU3_9TELE|nr:hypothetical protein AAFF_G00394380 [Aldrovandia affinis]